MNFIAMQRQVFWSRGRTDENQIQDFERQQVQDLLNAALDEVIAALRPYYYKHLEVDSFTITSGTQVYTLADDCVRPIAFWTANSQARAIPYWDPRMVDMNGERNSSLSLSRAHAITWYPDTTSAGSSGAVGATAGVSVSNASTSVTKSGGTAFASTDVGKTLRLNGEFEDTIASVGGDNALELTRPFRGRLTGDATDNSPSGLTQVAWEISPPGRFRVEIPASTVSETETIYYRYARKHKRLINDTDVPDIDEYAHSTLYWRAISLDSTFRDKPNQQAEVSYLRGLDRIVSDNIATHATQFVMPFVSQVHGGYDLFRPSNETDYGRRRR